MYKTSPGKFPLSTHPALWEIGLILRKIFYMKKLLSLTLLTIFAATTMFAQTGNAKKGNYKGGQGTPHEVVTGNHMTISYGRPYKKGREIFGGLVPYGQVWRAGADEATEITFDKDGMFGGKKIAAGTYTLFVIPNKTMWTIILNSKLGQGGAFGYEKVKDQDVLLTDMPSKQVDQAVEQFTITIKDKGLIMEWDKTSVAVPVNF